MRKAGQILLEKPWVRPVDDLLGLGLDESRLCQWANCDEKAVYVCGGTIPPACNQKGGRAAALCLKHTAKFARMQSVPIEDLPDEVRAELRLKAGGTHDK